MAVVPVRGRITVERDIARAVILVDWCVIAVVAVRMAMSVERNDRECIAAVLVDS
jgi:predicted fused transcriptional regulator/phosphomethylpyrimidine kinase